uniref:Uncharacterized protein n=1 Tax=Setaria italica TaxID=4555 RepID=K3ZFF9_SETIT
MARGLCGISAAATPACRRERSPFQRCRHGVEGGKRRPVPLAHGHAVADWQTCGAVVAPRGAGRRGRASWQWCAAAWRGAVAPPPSRRHRSSAFPSGQRHHAVLPRPAAACQASRSPLHHPVKAPPVRLPILICFSASTSAASSAATTAPPPRLHHHSSSCSSQRA